MAYPTLADIATKYKELAKRLAPVKTGRLRDSIATSYKKLSDTQYQFDLNMVSYGLWWNVPPPVVKRVKLSRKPQFNFAVKAANSKDLQTMINQYVKAEIDIAVTQKMQEAFEKGGYGKLRQSFRK
jgi:hypothetical protein